MVLKASVRGGEKLKATAKVLREAGRQDLQRAVNAAVKAEGQPTLRDLRAAARRIRVSGRRAGGPPFVHHTAAKRLRERIAAATALEFRASDREARVTFHVVSARMGGARVVPRYLDLGKPFRHPIMGNRSRWATSQGQPWFFEPIKDNLPAFRKAISDRLDEVVDKIERS